MIHLTTLLCRRITAEVLFRILICSQAGVPSNQTNVSVLCRPQKFTLISRQVGGSTLLNDHSTLGTFERFRHFVPWLIMSSLLLFLAHHLQLDR